MILIFGALLAVYVFCRAILPLRLKWGWKALLAVLLAVAAFKFHLLHLFGGPMFFSPVLPEGVLVLLAFAAVLATVGMVGGTGVPRVKEETISVNHLPDGADGLAVAVLADLHVDGITRADCIRKIVERTNALNPDIVIIAGDFVDGTVPVHGDDLRPLADLKARYGVPGNHEYYSGYEEWMKFLPTLGIRMLHNEHVLTGGDAVVLAGVTDPVAGIMGKEVPDIRKALAGAPEKGVRILASHQPRLAPEAAAHGVDLQVSGHTHGGMIAGIDRLVARFNEGFVSGLYTVGEMKLYVSNGAGIWNGFPIRIGVPSEIVLIRLRKEE